MNPPLLLLLAALTTVPSPVPPGPERAATAALAVRSRLEEIRVPAPSLVGALLGSGAVRHALVYLPPSYDQDTDRRYPVLYLLHGFGVGPDVWLGVNGFEDMDLSEVMDQQAESDPTGEFIIVMPDARTSLGGSWYTNSPATGRWTDFVARDLVSFVDRAYRTHAEAAGRGIAGHSMGGYGALRVALWYPGVFGAVAALSAPNLVTTNPFGVDGVRLAMAVPDLTTLDLSDPVARLMWSKAAAFAPDPQAPPFYGRLPWRDGADGRLEHDPVGWPAWEASALAAHLPERAGALADIPIRIEVGGSDPLRDESEGLVRALNENGIRPRLDVFEGDHVRGVRRRFERELVRFFAEVFSARTGVSPR